ncbi:AAA family ATPase [Rhodoferax sp.]|uniref:ATP-binding protein n=1 Tax=Rhodoferax sp. TaxID=50421 RepID=UPI00343D7D26
MSFPFSIQSSIQSEQGAISRTVTLHNGLTVILGPNGSGKTHLMRGMKSALIPHCAGKRVRFLSAGRVGLFEQFRSDYDGHRGGQP